SSCYRCPDDPNDGAFSTAAPKKVGNGAVREWFQTVAWPALESQSHCRVRPHPSRSVPMSTNRREFIVGTGAALAAAAFPANGAKTDRDAKVEALLAELAEELLVDYPETATSLGIDVDDRAKLKSKLTDRSARGQAAIARRVA